MKQPLSDEQWGEILSITRLLPLPLKNKAHHAVHNENTEENDGRVPGLNGSLRE